MKTQHILGKLHADSDPIIPVRVIRRLKNNVSLFTLTRHPNGNMCYTLPGNKYGLDGKWWFRKSMIKGIVVNENGQQFLEGLFE